MQTHPCSSTSKCDVVEDLVPRQLAYIARGTVQCDNYRGRRLAVIIAMVEQIRGDSKL